MKVKLFYREDIIIVMCYGHDMKRAEKVAIVLGILGVVGGSALLILSFLGFLSSHLPFILNL